MSETARRRSGVIVQARLGSTRLPGKVLMLLAGQTVLSHVLARCLAIGTDVVCCAIPATERDDPVAAEAEKAGVVVWRGSEDDVLDRYHQAAQHFRLDVILRVTADCPLLDPGLCRQVLDLHHQSGADYACNNQPPTWPHGLDCEAISASWLARSWREAVQPWQREHVTPYVRTHEAARRVTLEAPDPAWSHHRWTLDHPRDFDLLTALFQRLPAGPAGWDHRAVLAVIDREPALVSINKGFDRDEGLKRSIAASTTSS